MLAGCLRRHLGDVDEALLRYEEARRPATAAIVQANRGLGPELPMQLVEQHAPDGFADIADVITPEEIADVTERYRTTAGFSLTALRSAACRSSKTPIRSEEFPPAWQSGGAVGQDATVGPAESDSITAARFSGRVAIITGSTADPSIGRSCALRLAREGALVVVNGRDEDRVASTEAAFRAEGLSVVGVAGSMDRELAVSQLTDRAVEAFGRIDLIVSTVGGAPHPLSFDAISEEQLLETFRLNTWPTVALIRAALAAGLGENAGSVVTISSGSPRKTTSAMVPTPRPRPP